MSNSRHLNFMELGDSEIECCCGSEQVDAYSSCKPDVVLEVNSRSPYCGLLVEVEIETTTEARYDTDTDKILVDDYDVVKAMMVGCGDCTLKPSFRAEGAAGKRSLMIPLFCSLPVHCERFGRAWKESISMMCV